MRAVIQRVSKARVHIEGSEVATIERGLVALIAIGEGDGRREIDYVVDKICNLRIFEREGKFDLSLVDVGGEALVVSNFTLYGDASKGRRPSFTGAMAPAEAAAVYEEFVVAISGKVPTKSGRFQSMMDVELTNEGPVTIIIDSAKVTDGMETVG